MTWQLPLCSSRQVVSALKRLGFKRGKAGKGSHQSYVRGSAVVIVIEGKKEIPRGTLKSILQQAGVSEEEFLRALK